MAIIINDQRNLEVATLQLLGWNGWFEYFVLVIDGGRKFSAIIQTSQPASTEHILREFPNELAAGGIWNEVFV